MTGWAQYKGFRTPKKQDFRSNKSNKWYEYAHCANVFQCFSTGFFVVFLKFAFKTIYLG